MMGSMLFVTAPVTKSFKPCGAATMSGVKLAAPRSDLIFIFHCMHDNMH